MPAQKPATTTAYSKRSSNYHRLPPLSGYTELSASRFCRNRAEELRSIHDLRLGKAGSGE